MPQSYTNEKFVQRRNKIGSYVSLASFGFLGVGAYFAFTSFSNPNAELVLNVTPNAEPWRISQILLSYILMFTAIALTSFGSRFLIYSQLKPESKLSLALKGLDKNYRLYSYTLPQPFVVLTPFAVYVLNVKTQEGEIVVKGDKWSQSFSFWRLARFFASEPLGNPPQQLEQLKAQMKKWLADKLPNLDVPIEGYVVILNPGAKVKSENPTVSVVELQRDADALKNAFRRDKRANMPSNVYGELATLFKSYAKGEVNNRE